MLDPDEMNADPLPWPSLYNIFISCRSPRLPVRNNLTELGPALQPSDALPTELRRPTTKQGRTPANRYRAYFVYNNNNIFG